VNKFVIIGIIAAFSIALISANHFHSSASNDYFKTPDPFGSGKVTDEHVNVFLSTTEFIALKDNRTIENPFDNSNLFYEYTFGKDQGLLIYTGYYADDVGFDIIDTQQHGCTGNNFEYCYFGLESTMYVKDKFKSGLAKSAETNGLINYTWNEIQPFKDKQEKSKVRFLIEGFLEYKVLGKDTIIQQRNFKTLEFSIEDDKLSDPKIKICLDGETKTIYKSQKEDFTDLGAGVGECEEIKICLDEEEQTIFKNEFSEYEDQGAVKGKCNEMKICLDGNEEFIINSEWDYYKSEGAINEKCKPESVAMCSKISGDTWWDVDVGNWEVANKTASGALKGTCDSNCKIPTYGGSCPQGSIG